VIPPGRAPVPSVTFDAKPVPGAIVIVVVVDAPGNTGTVDGAALSVNDDGDATVTVTVVVPVRLPLVPLIVTE